MIRTLVYSGAALLLLAACRDTHAPNLPATPLGDPVDSLALPYTYVSNALWLGGRRWAFTAPNEHDAVIVDLATDSIQVLGGARHPAYQEPVNLFLSGDSLYLGDWGKRTITVWSLDGRLARTMNVGDFPRGVFPEARDNQRRYYSRLPPRAGADGSGNRDSAAIVRMPPGEPPDTVARLAPPDIAEVFGDAGRRYEPRALSGNDAWGVFPDGTVWIARVNQNRVDRRAPDGAWQRGLMLPDRVLPVQPEDRDRFLDQFPEELRSTAEKVPFAIIKPPFESAFAGPGGDVWIVKNSALTDTTRSAQRVGPDGGLVATYEWKGYGRLIGASDSTLLVAQPGVKTTLAEYRIPVPAATAER